MIQILLFLGISCNRQIALLGPPSPGNEKTAMLILLYLIYLAISLVLLLVLLWVAVVAMAPRRLPKEDAGLPIEALLPVSMEKYFRMQEMIRDTNGLRRRSTASQEERRAMAAARRRLTEELLADLKRDFSSLDRLMCAIAAVSPNPSGRRETERAWLWVRFRLHYWFAWLRLNFGTVSEPQLNSIRQLLDNLVVRTRAALEAVEENSLVPLRSRLGT